MNKDFKKILKATIIDIMVAFIFIIIFFIAISIMFGDKIKMATSLANKMVIEEKKEEIKPINISDNRLDYYPEYGTKYATIEIPKIDKKLPMYYGDTLTILKNGIGHSSGSYFPGENGSIITMGHNSKNMLRRLGELKIGDKITITTEYGKFEYEIYDTKLIKETETEMLPIQKEKEILMLYTCYPFNNIGYATQRYVVYANKVN